MRCILTSLVETLVMGCACKDYHTNVDYANEYVAVRERISVIYGCIADALSIK